MVEFFFSWMIMKKCPEPGWQLQVKETHEKGVFQQFLQSRKGSLTRKSSTWVLNYSDRALSSTKNDWMILYIQLDKSKRAVASWFGLIITDLLNLDLTHLGCWWNMVGVLRCRGIFRWEPLATTLNLAKIWHIYDNIHISQPFWHIF